MNKTFRTITPEVEMLINQTVKKYNKLEFVKTVEKRDFIPEDIVNIEFATNIVFITKDNTQTLYNTKHGTMAFILNSNLEVHKGRQIINSSIFRHEIKPFFKIIIPSFYNIEVKKNPKLEYLSNVNMFFTSMYPNSNNNENTGYADEFRLIKDISFHIDFDNYYFNKYNLATFTNKEDYLFEFIFTPLYCDLKPVSNIYTVIKNTDVYEQIENII